MYLGALVEKPTPPAGSVEGGGKKAGGKKTFTARDLSPEMRESAERFVKLGIMTMDEKNVALINNEIYEVGDMINGMKIMDITLNSVKLLHNKRIQTLKVSK